MEEYIKPIVSQDVNMGQSEYSLYEPVLANIREHWDWVREGVVETLTTDPQTGVMPEDVFAACVNNQAHLWVFEGGFLVTTGTTETYSNERILLLWIGWTKERGRNLALAYQPFFEKQARDAGFSALEFRTTVKEVGEYAEAANWTRRETVYTSKV